MSSNDLDAPKSRTVEALDNFILAIGHITSWVYAILVGVIVLEVALRYGFAAGKVALEELQWHLYAVGFMLGLSYCMVTNSHVRVDLLRSSFSLRQREWFEIIGLVFLWLPFIAVVLFHSYYFVGDSWVHSERSVAPSGLPYRWAIKSFVPISFTLLGLASISRILRAVVYLRRKNYADN